MERRRTTRFERPAEQVATPWDSGPEDAHESSAAARDIEIELESYMGRQPRRREQASPADDEVGGRSSFYDGESMPISQRPSRGKAKKGKGKSKGKAAPLKRHRTPEPRKDQWDTQEPPAKEPRTFAERRPTCQGCFEVYVRRREECRCSRVRCATQNGAVLCAKCYNEHHICRACHDEQERPRHNDFEQDNVMETLHNDGVFGFINDDEFDKMRILAARAVFAADGRRRGPR